MKFHPYAELFPMIEGADFEALKEDIRANGQREPIWVFNGEVLDGRNRYRACESLGVPVRSQEYDGDDPLGFVISLNLRRRHLDESQRAMVATKLESLKHGGSRQDEKLLHEVTRSQAAALLNVSPRTVAAAAKVKGDGAPELVAAVERGDISVSKAASIAEAPPEFQKRVVERVRSGEKPVEAVRQERMAGRKAAPLPKDKYRVIYADPPWKYGDSRITLGSATGAEHHYPTMSLDEICAMPIRDLAADDSVLFLWATSPLLEDAFKVINAWGFKYKANFVWDKVRHNLGHYNSVRHEFLLIATNGSCTPDSSKLLDSVVELEKTDKHSEKPEEFRQIIDTLYTHGARLELFRRGGAPAGWSAWGNETEAA